MGYGGIPNSWMVEKMFIDVLLHNVSRIDDLGMYNPVLGNLHVVERDERSRA